MTDAREKRSAPRPALPGRLAPRRAWVAALLGPITLTPGLGQLYNGRPGKGCLAFGAAWGLTLAVLLALTFLPLGRAGPFLLLAIPLWALVVAVEAAVEARRKGATYRLRPYNRPLGYMFALGMVWTAGSWVVWPGFSQHVVSTYGVTSQDMSGTILAGDLILTNRLARGRVTSRGDVVVLASAEDSSLFHFRRVIGLPGETVEVKGHRAIVDGRPLDEPYARTAPLPEKPSPADHGPVEVPSGRLFVLGDNRPSSTDSRAWGCVSVGDVLGRAERVFASRDPSAGEIDWTRAGLPVR